MYMQLNLFGCHHHLESRIPMTYSEKKARKKLTSDALFPFQELHIIRAWRVWCIGAGMSVLFKT